MIKLAIHYRNGSFSNRWAQYCQEKGIPFKYVDCYDTNIIQHLQGFNGLMWHWTTSDYKAALAARQITLSLEKAGINVFPEFNTSWHYDDKVGQKYLLEAMGAPLVKSYVFYSKKDALNWIEHTSFPKVFKLRNGAGSYNVKLVRDKQEAKLLIGKAFNNGFHRAEPYPRLKEKIRILKRDKSLTAAKKVIKGIARLVFLKENEKLSKKEKGYVYFQDFIPDNTFDTRLVVIGDRCFGARRYCRPNDFRASGSGLFTYRSELIDKKMIAIAFDVSKKLGAQSLAYDFILDQGSPKIVEISYCFAIECCDDAPGYWDRNLRWKDKNLNLQYYMVEDFIKRIEEQKMNEVSYMLNNPATLK